MDHDAHAQASGPPPPRLSPGEGYFIWYSPVVAGAPTVALGVYDHPPPTAALELGFTYREVGPSRVNWFLRETTEQATKWLVWTKRLPPLPP